MDKSMKPARRPTPSADDLFAALDERPFYARPREERRQALGEFAADATRDGW
jgi:hypothetical protein